MIAATDQADWIAGEDQAAVWLLRDLTLVLDHHRRQGRLLDLPVKDVGELAGRCLQLLRELALTPAQRYRLGLADDGSADALAAVLKIAAGDDAAGR